jgi:hypothetical protein
MAGFFCVLALFFRIFALLYGELSEWLKEHAWKVCIGQKPIEGSNPSLSAKIHEKSRLQGGIFIYGPPKAEARLQSLAGRK